MAARSAARRPRLARGEGVALLGPLLLEQERKEAWRHLLQHHDCWAAGLDEREQGSGAARSLVLVEPHVEGQKPRQAGIASHRRSRFVLRPRDNALHASHHGRGGGNDEDTILL